MFFDAQRLLRLSEVVDELDPDGPPRARFIGTDPAKPPRRLALLPGSFNPPTKAHVALADAVMATGRVDRVDYLLATRTVNKEQVEGASLPDRLLMLEALALSDSHRGIVLVNRGLLVDQAELVRAEAASIVDLWFAIGFDKIVQVFDPRYYREREAALDRLFSLARFFVAPRAGAELDDLEALMSSSENQRYTGGIVKLDLPASLRDVSSSRLRAHDPESSSDAPGIVREFIRETGAYGLGDTERGLGDRYGARERVLHLVRTGRLTLATTDEFRAAIDRLREDELRSQSGTAPGPQLPDRAPRTRRADRS